VRRIRPCSPLPDSGREQQDLHIFPCITLIYLNVMVVERPNAPLMLTRHRDYSKIEPRGRTRHREPGSQRKQRVHTAGNACRSSDPSKALTRRQ
jgi:hypothetical protein